MEDMNELVDGVNINQLLTGSGSFRSRLPPTRWGKASQESDSMDLSPKRSGYRIHINLRDLPFCWALRWDLWRFCRTCQVRVSRFNKMSRRRHTHTQPHAHIHPHTHTAIQPYSHIHTQPHHTTLTLHTATLWQACQLSGACLTRTISQFTAWTHHAHAHVYTVLYCILSIYIYVYIYIPIVYLDPSHYLHAKI
jgi:hypothetical protein